MPEKNWTLTDVERGISLSEFDVSPRSTDTFPDASEWFPGHADWSVLRQTLRGGVSEGVDVIHVNNGRLAFSVLPTRGMGLWKGTFEGLALGWQSPVRFPVNPSFVNQAERGGLGWLCGFNEWMCRCGLDSNGAPAKDVVVNDAGQSSESILTLHGKIANLPAHFVEVRVSTGKPGKIAVTGVIDETMLFGPALRLKSTVETTPGSNHLTLIDEVTNLRSTPGELELLYHINFGPPFLEAGARLVAPVLEMAPLDVRAAAGLEDYATFGGPESGFVEQCYFFELAADKAEATAVLLRNFHGDKGVSVHFNKRQLPYFTLWKSTQAESDGYVTGLEPGTDFPNSKTFERQQGRVLRLKPGETYRTEVELRIHNTAEGVSKMEHAIAALQKPNPPRIHAQPLPKYTPTN